MPRHIAIVEDEPVIRRNYTDAFEREGYTVSAYADRTAALQSFGAGLPELVLIDVSLGTEAEGGFDLCRELRTMSVTLPIIFLTARDSDLDVVSGLRLGADDYLTKDISLAHLLARIAALFRRLEARQSTPAAESLLQHGSLELDAERLALRWRNTGIDLTITEFWFVHTLVRFPGHVKSREQLMQDARIVVDDQTITSHIKRIRRKFLAVDPSFESIETVYGAGYRWKVDRQE